MSTPKNIVFVISSLQGGGAERVVCSMANYWVERQHVVTVVLFANNETPISYYLSPRVKILALDVLGKKNNAFCDNFNRIKILRNTFKNLQPDTIISFMESTNVLSILSAVGLKIPVVITDRIAPKQYCYGKLWRVLRNITYPFSTHFVVQTQSVIKQYPALLAKHACVIPNFVNVSGSNHDYEERPVICAMGRLEVQKGFDILIRAFAAIKSEFPYWSLEIWGEGEQRQSLEKLIIHLGVDNCVRLPGFSNTPHSTMHKSGIFVSSSRYEGFPNVLVEAMALGKPVISTRCPHGPEDIIRDKYNGLLVPVDDVDALSSALRLLLTDSSLKSWIAKNAKIVNKTYKQKDIMDRWDVFICAA